MKTIVSLVSTDTTPKPQSRLSSSACWPQAFLKFATLCNWIGAHGCESNANDMDVAKHGRKDVNRESQSPQSRKEGYEKEGVTSAAAGLASAAAPVNCLQPIHVDLCVVVGLSRADLTLLHFATCLRKELCPKSGT